MTDEKRNRVFNARNKLRQRPRTVYLEHIAAETGLSFDWLKAFSSGKHPNPHTRKLAILEEYLIRSQQAN